MEMSFQERSNYFKGMLLLMCREEPIDEKGKNRLRRLAKILGFEPQFCEYVMKHFLDNTFIIKEPPRFSNKEIAKIFIRDGIKISFADNILHTHEIELLHKVAIENHLSNKWFARELYGFLDSDNHDFDHSFEIAKFFEIRYDLNSNVNIERPNNFVGSARFQSNS